MRAVLDSCFIIDWVRYRRREVLFKAFEHVYILPEVLNELKSERTVKWVSKHLESGKILIYVPSEDERVEALRFIELTSKVPHYPTADMPEALGIVIAKKRGLTLLSENRAVLYAPMTFEEYRGVKVWRAIDLIAEIFSCDFEKMLGEYVEDTGRLYSRRLVEQIKGRVRCARKGLGDC